MPSQLFKKYTSLYKQMGQGVQPIALEALYEVITTGPIDYKHLSVVLKMSMFYSS